MPQTSQPDNHKRRARVDQGQHLVCAALAAARLWAAQEACTTESERSKLEIDLRTNQQAAEHCSRELIKEQQV